jgi:hypothetical protein
MTAVNGLFTGTAGNDQLTIGAASDGNLTNNRFAAGDPGFESAEDFDSTVAGVQTRLAGSNQQFRFSAGDGDDTLTLVGNLAPAVIRDLDMGAGKDVVNAGSMTGHIEIGFAGELMETVEVIVGTSYDDKIYNENIAAIRALPLTIFGGAGDDTITGSEGPDRLDGGGGNDAIGAGGGDYVVSVEFPLPATEGAVDGGAGSDLIAVYGTAQPDELALAGPAADFYAWDIRDYDGGYHATAFEAARLNLAAGDDFAVVSSAIPYVTVTGGAGSDELLVDSLQTTPTVDMVGAARRVTVPVPYGNTPTGPSSVKADAAVERVDLANETTIATAPGAGSGPHVRTFRADGTPLASFMAYDPSFTGGVNIALGDVNGDADDDIVTAPSGSGGPHVRVFYSDGTDTGVGFFAYDPSFTGGVNVAAMDLDFDGVDEIVTVPASNSAPLVRIWSGTGELLGEFLAQGFGNTGLRVAAGSVAGTYGEQILISAASGSPSNVRMFDADGTSPNAFGGYAPYGSFQGGASVSRGLFANTNGAYAADVYDEIVTGAGPGGTPLVRVAQPSLYQTSMTQLSAFYAYTSSFKGGVEVTSCNADGGPDEIVTAPGAGASPLIRTFNLDGSIKRKSFLAYDTGMKAGVHIACGGTLSRVYTR